MRRRKIKKARRRHRDTEFTNGSRTRDGASEIPSWLLPTPAMEACDGTSGIGGVALSQEDFMRHSLLAAVSVSPLLFFSLAGSGGAQAPQPNQLSGPLVHENLAIYFIRGPSAPGK